MKMVSCSSGRASDPEEFLQIVQDDKFFNRLLSKESSMANPSGRVYYGVAPGEVPFMWESQPGTPKDSNSTTSLPPLTPPPSYLYTPSRTTPTSKKYSKSNLLKIIFPKLTFRKPNILSPSASASSSSYSPSKSPMGTSNAHEDSPGSSFPSKSDNNCPSLRSLTLPLCFGAACSRTAIQW